MNGQADYAEVDTRGLSTFMNGRRDQPTPYATTTLLNRRPVPCQQDGCVSPGSNRRCPPAAAAIAQLLDRLEQFDRFGTDQPSKTLPTPPTRGRHL
ncbi:unnamed protein product, partial [Nesidiocoris tenuis]